MLISVKANRSAMAVLTSGEGEILHPPNRNPCLRLRPGMLVLGVKCRLPAFQLMQVASRVTLPFSMLSSRMWLPSSRFSLNASAMPESSKMSHVAVTSHSQNRGAGWFLT